MRSRLLAHFPGTPGVSLVVRLVSRLETTRWESFIQEFFRMDLPCNHFIPVIANSRMTVV